MGAYLPCPGSPRKVICSRNAHPAPTEPWGRASLIIGAVRRRLLGLLSAAALALSCDRGALQPAPGTPGAAGAGAIGSIGGSGGGPGSGGAAGSVVAPGCDRISTAPGVFNPCGRTYAIAFSAESG